MTDPAAVSPTATCLRRARLVTLGLLSVSTVAQK